jgi:D-glycero-beta-D-manno-heptose-7-phosphate kinase
MDAFFRDQLLTAQPRLNQLIDRFPQAKVLVIGDLALDEFMVGQTERISREAPVLILRHEQTHQVPGGGANAVYNLAKLGAQVKAVGLVGNDSQGIALRRIFQEVGIDTTGILVEPERPTVTKTRISGHARQSVTQQIVRVDRKSDDPPTLELQQQMADYIAQEIASVDAVICSDYGDGVFMTLRERSPAIAAALHHSLCVVDAQIDLGRYHGATLFTPNLPEAELAVGYGIDNPDNLDQAGQDLLKLTAAQQMLITRGDEGMSLFTAQEHLQIPAFNRTDVFDVTGAGDTVVAALTLALCAGATFWEAAILGNLAASIVIRQVGTATTNPTEIKALLTEILEVI